MAEVSKTRLVWGAGKTSLALGGNARTERVIWNGLVGAATCLSTSGALYLLAYACGFAYFQSLGALVFSFTASLLGILCNAAFAYCELLDNPLEDRADDTPPVWV
jgi:hypothetical protein